MNVAILLGRQDIPSDGVEDYSCSLAEALSELGHSVQLFRVPWHSMGFWGAIKQLPSELSSSPRDWILMQFTHLMWSRRGFSLIAIAVAKLARRSGSRVAVTMHDPVAFPGGRRRDAVRRWIQNLIMKELVRTADHVFVTLPPDALPWLKHSSLATLTYVPVGSNIPPSTVEQSAWGENQVFTIAVFGVGSGRREIEEIAEVTRAVAEELGALAVVLLGRGSSEAAPVFRKLIGESAISLLVKGLAPVEDISSCLNRADALLFLRGEVSTRRGTAIAAIAHGLPVVGYRGRDTRWPITEAGLILGSVGDTTCLTKGLIELAQDPSLRGSLRDRNRVAYANYFSWDRIGATVEESLLCHQ